MSVREWPTQDGVYRADGHKLEWMLYPDGRDAFLVARWGWDGCMYFSGKGVNGAGVKALADFIAAGPPKKRYRITRTFDWMPTTVSSEQSSKEIWTKGLSGRQFTNLTPDDIEEI